MVRDGAERLLAMRSREPFCRNSCTGCPMLGMMVAGTIIHHITGGNMKRSIAALVLTTSLVFAGSAFAQGKLDKVVKVGSLGDQSSLYADIGGPGSVGRGADGDRGFRASRQGLEDRPDLGGSPEQARRRHQHRQAMDRRREGRCVVDLASSGVGLAVANVAKEKNIVNLNSGSASSDLTGSQCSPNTVHWVYDT